MTVCGFVLSVAGLIGLLLAVASVRAQTSRADSANSYLERGNQWLKKGEVEKAIGDYSLGLAFAPTSAVLLYNRGVAYVRTSNLTAAEADFNCRLMPWRLGVKRKSDPRNSYNALSVTSPKIVRRTALQAERMVFQILPPEGRYYERRFHFSWTDPATNLPPPSYFAAWR